MNDLATFAEGFGLHLLDTWPTLMLGTGFLLFGALLLDRVLERRIAAATRLLLYLPVIARLALPVGWQTPFGLLGRAPTSTSTELGSALLGPALSVTAGSAAPTYGLVVTLLYLGGVLTLGTSWVLARRRLARALRSARPVARDHAGGGVAFFQHAELGPLVAGIWRPRIVVPTALMEGTAEKLGFILAHELAHVRRRDHLLLPALQLVTIVGWPLLPVWIAARRIRALIELASDEAVLVGRDGPTRRRYGELLLALSQDAPLGTSRLAPSFGWDLRGRMRALRKQRRWPRALQRTTVAAVATTLLACAGAPADEVPSAQVAKPPVLSFDESGGLWLNQAKTELASLEGDLRAALARSGSSELHLRFARRAGRIENMVELMTMAKRAGAQQIHLVPTAESTEKPSPPTLRGDSFDTVVVRDAIRAYLPEVKNCYEASLKPSARDNRRLDLAFTITTRGTVAAPRIVNQSGAANPALDVCLLTAMKRWTFPPPADDTEVSFPMVLEGNAP